MPYYFDGLDTPIEQDHEWDLFQEMWYVIHADLMGVHFETSDEALDQKYEKSLDPNDMRIDSWNVARYRETDDRENLEYFHEMGLEALAYTEAGIKNRNLDTEFIYYWSQLTSSHGYLCAAMMALGDDMQSKRAGRAAAAATNLGAQRLWFSHVYLKLQNPKEKREITDYMVVQLIQGIITDGIFPDSNFDKTWYSKILSDKGNGYFELTSGFQQRGLSVKEMNRLIKANDQNIPDTENLHDP